MDEVLVYFAVKYEGNFQKILSAYKIRKEFQTKKGRK